MPSGTGSIWPDLDRLRFHLDDARKRGKRRVVARLRQAIAVSTAASRAEAGDPTAARRLGWREVITNARGHGYDLADRSKTLARTVKRLLREGNSSCSVCGKTYARAQQALDELLAEIATLPGTVPTWAEYCRSHPIEVAPATAATRPRLRVLRGGRR